MMPTMTPGMASKFGVPMLMSMTSSVIAELLWELSRTHGELVQPPALLAGEAWAGGLLAGRAAVEVLLPAVGVRLDLLEDGGGDLLHDGQSPRGGGESASTIGMRMVSLLSFSAHERGGRSG